MISRDVQTRLGSLFENTVIDAVVSLIFGVLVLSSPVDVEAQGKPDRISIVRQTMEFGSDTLAMTALHLRMTNPVREEAVGEDWRIDFEADAGGSWRLVNATLLGES